MSIRESCPVKCVKYAKPACPAPQPVCPVPQPVKRPCPTPQPVCPMPQPVCSTTCDEDRQVYNMSVKPNWRMIIGVLIGLAILIIVILFLSWILHGTSVHDVELHVPTTTLTVSSTVDGVVYMTSRQVPGGVFFETVEPTIAGYTSQISSVLSGPLTSTLGTTFSNSGTMTFDPASYTFTISLNRADTMSVYSSNPQYWRSLGYGVPNTITLIDDAQGVPGSMNSLTSNPITLNYVSD